MLVVQVLGQIRVWRDATEVELGSPGRRAVFGLLVLARGRPITRAEMVDALWDEEPPSTAANVVQTHVMHLRRLLEPARPARTPSQLIRTVGDGYRLVLDDARVDLARFRELVDGAGSVEQDGAWQAAATTLGEALALWHGPALVDVPALARHRWVLGLGLERRRAVARYVDAMVALGAGSDALGPALADAVEHPLDEAAQARLLRVYRSTGQRDQALTVYHQTRQRLAEDLGITPCAELAAALAELLGEADPPVAVAGRRPEPPRQLPADVPHFVGRTAELEHLDRIRAEPATVVICGEPGVGKTAFALRWAHRSRERFPDGQLYLDLRGYGTGQPLAAADALVHLCVALGRAEADLPTDAAGRASVFRTESAGRRLLVVLDNAASADQVRPLLPGSGASAVLVTSRDHLGGLVALEGASRVELPALPPVDAVTLLRRLIGSRVAADPASAAVLAEQCARLPLALRVAAELAASWPQESLANLTRQLADRQGRLDLLDAGGDTGAAVREVLSWSYQSLDPQTARALRYVALHPGPEFDAAAVAALIGVDVRVAQRMLAVLARGHLIEPRRAGRYRMHDLMRAYAEELLHQLDDPDARRAAAGRMLDYYVGGVCRARAVLHPSWRGYLPQPGNDTGPKLPDVVAAVAWLDREQPNLGALCAYAVRGGWPRHAIGIAANLHRHFEAGRYCDGLTIHSFALEAARQLGDDAARAHLLTHIGEIHRLQGQYDAATRYLGEALRGHRGTGDARGEARALSGLGIVAERIGDHDAATRHHRRALARFRSADDRRGEAGVLVNLGNVYSGQDQPGRAAEAFERAYTVFRELDEATGQAAALTNLGDVLVSLGRYDEAAARLDAALPLFRAAGHRNGEATVWSNLGQLELCNGAPARAMDNFRRALRIFQETGHRYGEASARNGMGEVLRTQKRHVEALACHQAALAIAAETGDRDEERRALAAIELLVPGGPVSPIGRPAEVRR